MFRARADTEAPATSVEEPLESAALSAFEHAERLQRRLALILEDPASRASLERLVDSRQDLRWGTKSFFDRLHRALRDGALPPDRVIQDLLREDPKAREMLLDTVFPQESRREVELARAAVAERAALAREREALAQERTPSMAAAPAADVAHWAHWERRWERRWEALTRAMAVLFCGAGFVMGLLMVRTALVGSAVAMVALLGATLMTVFTVWLLNTLRPRAEPIDLDVLLRRVVELARVVLRVRDGDAEGKALPRGGDASTATDAGAARVGGVT